MEEKIFTMKDLNQEYDKGFISAMKCTIASLEHERNIFKKAFKDEKMISLQLVLNRFENIISALKSRGIPFNLSENDSLMSNEEVKAMITLLWYMKEPDDKIILSSWEKDWLNNTLRNTLIFLIFYRLHHSLYSYLKAD